MAYRSRSSSRGYRAPAARRGGMRRTSARSTGRRSSVRGGSNRGRSGGGELRIVIEQAGASSVSRYPGVAAKLNPQPRKAKY